MRLQTSLLTLLAGGLGMRLQTSLLTPLAWGQGYKSSHHMPICCSLATHTDSAGRGTGDEATNKTTDSAGRGTGDEATNSANSYQMLFTSD